MDKTHWQQSFIFVEVSILFGQQHIVPVCCLELRNRSYVIINCGDDVLYVSLPDALEYVPVMGYELIH